MNFSGYFHPRGGRIPQERKIWQLIEVLREAATFLKSKGIENPRLNAELMLGAVLGCVRVDLYLAFDRPLSENERECFKTMLRRRAGHEPLQYILGAAEFLSLPFRVTPDVLIPRPETEILVEKAIEACRGVLKARICDIGSGSGAIGVSIAKKLPDVSVICTDVDSKALEVSKSNAEQNHVSERMRFIRADLFDDRFPEITGAPFSHVVSNPPYVSARDWENLPAEIRDFEPQKALLAGEDGLDCFRRIACLAGKLLAPGGVLLLEVGQGQSRTVAGLLTQVGLDKIQFDLDLNGVERIICAERK